MLVEGKAPEVVVAGAGVIGCAVARALARAGAAVTVVDPGEPGSRATRAAGGMLSPLGEADRPGPFLELGLASLELYPGFAAAVEEETGRDVGFLHSGKIQVAWDDERLDRLRERRTWLVERGFEARWLDADDVRRLEDDLADGVRGGLLLERERQVDNRKLGAALPEAARRAGARIRTGRAVRAVQTEGGRVRGVVLDDGERLAAGTVVVAAGAWSGRIEGLPRHLPVRPVRGQMVALATEGITLENMIETGRVYLIPRRGGPLIVGATQEEVGFRAHPTPAGISGLLEGAVRSVPSLADVELLESWAGLRPGTPDEQPILGPDPEIDGLHYATGHFRNGILLAPVTARIVVGLITGDADATPELDLDPFRPGRFREAD